MSDSKPLTNSEPMAAEVPHVHGPDCDHDHDHGDHHGHAHEPILPYRREAPKLGRNDPCFCGSGKKYKKCHGS